MAADLVIRNVTVIDGTGSAPATGADVVVRDGVFAAVGAGAASRQDLAGVAALDGHGKFLIPGLWESHTHLRTVLKASDEESQASLDVTLRDYLSRGVTSVVDLGGPGEIYSRLREQRRAAAEDGGARMLFAGQCFTGIGGWPLPLHHNPDCVY